ncbi:MAG: SDR family NAD(P)-dependent oxidoreductase [Candidatus Goldbacteria bacterium]|nr:SDR family NAD(P)-dependent oxidoreductase [Candidatus Goldiibacteriota bacterium]
MVKHVLVTGGAGFIGSNLSDELLKKGYKVTIIDNLSTGLKENLNPHATFIKGDVRNKKDVEKCFRKKVDVIFHIAGCASTIKSFHDPAADLFTNVLGTINVINSAIKFKIPRLLYASSMTSYGQPDAVPIKETMSTRPISYYGITKYSGERYCLATGLRNDLPFKLNVTALRMFNVYGRRQSLTNPYQGVVSIFIGNVLREEPVTIFGDGEQSRDYVHIKDVADAWIGAIDNKKSYGEVFNVGSGMRISINNLVDFILKEFGRNRKNYRVIYKEERPGDQKHMQADVSKAKKLLGWKPKISFEDGMGDTISWAKETWIKE